MVTKILQWTGMALLGLMGVGAIVPDEPSVSTPPVVEPAPGIGSAPTTLAPADLPTEPEALDIDSLSPPTSLFEEEEPEYISPAPPTRQTSNCHPSYSGCLNPNASDYDCAGGTGNGPFYTDAVEVYGSNPFDLDRDNDGWGCE